MFEHLIKRAEVFVEALPYLKKYRGKIMVIKYGGNALSMPEISKKMIADVALLKFAGISPILVHGGGPEITGILDKKGINSKFIEGMRVSTPQVIKIVEKVLSRINGDLVNALKKSGVASVGFYGKKGKLLKAKKHFVKTSKGMMLDLGLTGTVASVNKAVLLKALKLGAVPVVTSIGVGPGGKSYNINADQAASAVAGALKASKLILLTDVRGVLGHDGKLISSVSAVKVNDLIKNGVISGGMIPKVRAGIAALAAGVEKVHIIDGKIPHALLLEIFTNSGIGTMVVK